MADLKYPSDVGDGAITACVQFREFERLAIDSVAPVNTTTLYMPNEIQNPNTIEWDVGSGLEMGLDAAAGAAGIFSSILQGKAQSKVNAAAKAPGADFETGAAARNLQRARASQGRLNGVLGRAGQAIDLLGKAFKSSGASSMMEAIPNPYTVMLFKAVNLREFTFSFEFYPRSQQEATEILRIVNNFKGASLPAENSNSAGLSYPNEFEIQFLFNGHQNPFMPRFKHCVITGIDTNYTGQSVFAMTREGAPAEVKMSLTFKEIDILTRNDYDYDIKGVASFLGLMGSVSASAGVTIPQITDTGNIFTETVDVVKSWAGI